MAITLRNVKGTELSHAEMDTNFKSFYYSSSLNGNTLTLHTTGSTAHSHDIPDTNIANTNLVLSGDRTVNLNGNDLAFNVNGGEAFRISGSSTSQIQITDLPNTETPVVLGYNTTSGQLSYYSTGSFGSGGGGSIDTGSFYVSSSVSLNTITFTQGDGTTESVTIDTGSGGGGSIDTGSFYLSSSVSLNTITFTRGDGTTESVTVDTGSVVGSATPGGSDTYVQFNDGGSTFGGDSGLTYNKTANRLTITAPSSPSRTAPNLLLNSELSNVTAGEVLGVIAANNTTDQYNPANYPASIQFVADINYSPGVYDTGIRFYTNDGAVEKETLRLINTGQNRLPQYGSGTFTGTATKYLAVDSSGNIIEENAPSGFTRPGSDTSITYDTYLQTVGTYSVNAVGTNPAAPSSNGDVSIRYAVSNTASNVDRIDVYDSDGTDRSATLLNLATSGSITLLQTGTGGHTEVYRIISATDNTSYVSYAVSWVSGNDAAISTTTTDTFTFDADYEYELSTGYNRLLVTNNSNSSTNQLRFAPPAGASAGDEVIVELKVNTGSVNVHPTYLVRNGTPTLLVARRVSEINGSTISAIELDTNDVAIMKFQVNDIGSVEGLMLLGAAQMVYA